MTAPGRIPCIKPGCRRTGSREKHPDATQIICNKCWKAFVPIRLQRRYKMLNRELRRAERKLHRDKHRVDRLYHLHHVNWRAIRRAVAMPQRPAGLDAFLEETGL